MGKVLIFAVIGCFAGCLCALLGAGFGALVVYIGLKFGPIGVLIGLSGLVGAITGVAVFSSADKETQP